MGGVSFAWRELDAAGLRSPHAALPREHARHHHQDDPLAHPDSTCIHPDHARWRACARRAPADQRRQRAGGSTAPTVRGVGYSM